MSAKGRKKHRTDRLHRVRLFAGAARCIAERALQEDAAVAQGMLAYVEALTEFLEQELTGILGEE